MGKRCTDQELFDAVWALEQAKGHKTRAAAAIEISQNALVNRLYRAKLKGITAGGIPEPEPIEKIGVPPTLGVPDPEQKPTIRVRYMPDDQGSYLVIGIGDAHDSPGIPDKSRFRWLGAFAADIKPDWVVQIGDMFTMDSLCSYERNDSLRGKSKPAFMEDMVSGEAALAAFDGGLNDYQCDKHVTLGNHEDRVWSFTDRTPEAEGMMQLELDRLLARHGWTYSLYGMPWYLGGVALIHTPMSIMGRPIGGELSGNSVTLKATHDWVYGHDHRGSFYRRPKIGVNNSVSALDLGCALPQGHIEDYAKIATTGWTYGAWEIRISKGRIQSAKEHTMQELEERYG